MADAPLHSHAAGIHPGAYIQNTDPAVDFPDRMVSKVIWIDTSGAPLPLEVKKRNNDNDGWDLFGFLFPDDTIGDSLLNEEYIKSDGSRAFSGNQSMDNNFLTDVPTPIDPDHAVPKSYVDGLIAASDAVIYKGATDCSANPNYPAADAGHLYVVSVAGRIGGAAGIVVESGDMFICKTDGSVAGDQATVGVNWNVIQTNITDVLSMKTVTLPFIIDGGGATIAVGIKGDLGPFDFACTIQAVTLLANQSGSIVIDIWKDSYANFPPTVADTITAAAKPTITTATKSQNTVLTGWTTNIAIGDILRFNVDSVTDIQRVTLALKIVRN